MCPSLACAAWRSSLDKPGCPHLFVVCRLIPGSRVDRVTLGGEQAGVSRRIGWWNARKGTGRLERAGRWASVPSAPMRVGKARRDDERHPQQVAECGDARSSAPGEIVWRVSEQVERLGVGVGQVDAGVQGWVRAPEAHVHEAQHLKAGEVLARKGGHGVLFVR
jgi:hypothetical protein